MNEWGELIGILLVILIFYVGIFLILREYTCWYFKINKQISLMEEQNNLLKQLLGASTGNFGDVRNEANNLKNCPFCSNKINKKAIVCLFCGKNLLLSEETVEDSMEIDSDFYIVKQNTRLYQDDKMDSVLTVLRDGETVEYIEAGNLVTIGNITCRMWKVKTEYERVGFCFSGDLEKK